MKEFVFLALALLNTVTNGQNLNCNFDNDNTCAWTNVQGKDNADWQLRQGPTPSQWTGPPNDHTTNSSTGYYIYYEANNGKMNDKAQLQSPRISVTSGQKCLSFWYYMYGPSVNALNVYLKSGNTLGTAVYHRERRQGEKWNQATVTISNKTNIQVIIEAVRGRNYLSDIGVDDILYTNGACGQPAPSKYDCNFENGLCTWTQAQDDQFDWTLQTGSTGSGNTGPSFDHTMGQNGRGHYIFIEASSPRRMNDTARILSAPVIDTSKKCLHFWYHMYGIHVNTLNVYLKSGSSLGSPVWSHTGTLSNKWYNANINIQGTNQYNIVFEGVRGTSYRGDIGLDDISVTTGSCSASVAEALTGTQTTAFPTSSTLVTALLGNGKLLIANDEEISAPSKYDCNFENGLCTWTQAQDDQFDWTLQTGGTGSSSTGPSSDHTMGQNGRGHYIFVEASSPRRMNDTARILSAPVTDTSTKCLHFWYHMYGTHVNTLNVYLNSGSSLGSPVWNHTGTLSNKWYNANINIQGTNQYNIVFEGVRGTSYRGDIGLDDISVTTGSCSDERNPTA